MLGRKQYDESTNALYKNRTFIEKDKSPSLSHFGSFIPGSIDYTPHQESIRTIIEAMEQRKVCHISYKRPDASRAKKFYIKPLKLFSHKDSIYLHARLAKAPGKKYVEPEYDPLLAVHRIKKIDMTEREFEFPNDYDFEKVFNQNFGIVKADAFKVEVEFSGYAAKYVSERMWSPDQKIVRKRNGNIRLIFSASSEPEVVSWILSFGIEAVKAECNSEQRLLIEFVDETACRIMEAVRFRYEDVDGDLITLWTRKSRNSNLTPRRIPKPACIKGMKGSGKLFNYLKLPKFLRRKITELDQRVWSWHSLRHRRASIWCRMAGYLIKLENRWDLVGMAGFTWDCEGI